MLLAFTERAFAQAETEPERNAVFARIVDILNAAAAEAALDADFSLEAELAALEQHEPTVCAGEGASGCLLPEGYIAVSAAALVPSNIKTGVSVGGVSGTVEPALPDCSSSGSKSCSVLSGGSFTAVADSELQASNFKTGVSVGGVTGSFAGSYPACGESLEEGCLTSADVPSIKLAEIDSAEIFCGAVIAGVPGDCPARSLTGVSTLPETSEITEAGDAAAKDYELGMKFRVRSNGVLTQLRFFRAASEIGAHTLKVWKSDGTLLASQPLSTENEATTGWVIETLDSPLTLEAGATYTVSVNITEYWAVTTNFNYLGASNVFIDYLTGVFHANPGVFPDGSFTSYYFVDITFIPTSMPQL